MDSMFSLWPSGREFESWPSQYLLLFFSPKWDKKWVLACQNFGVRTVRVKLEFTVIRRYAQSWKLRNEIEICN